MEICGFGFSLNLYGVVWGFMGDFVIKFYRLCGGGWS